MKKYRKVAINIAFLMMILSAGITNSYLFINTIENNDYETWRKIAGQNNKTNKVIDETAFKSFNIARTAARNGQYNKALKITEGLKRKVENNLV